MRAEISIEGVDDAIFRSIKPEEKRSISKAKLINPEKSSY